jgi:hypothetical protein
MPSLSIDTSLGNDKIFLHQSENIPGFWSEPRISSGIVTGFLLVLTETLGIGYNILKNNKVFK